ncbi:NlpC/P60 family protein [Amycolatopsis cihanbeyliensis]|uniref:Cell wall-associated NlpC family hydrolase n=1 Tax=Amycolatopsis cihanbeyliensis TaxID=1128664 RepID=A0A542DPQ6_AMYCI|nr:bifunctional lytic transglycosylase/C40 family peptidase [Amycolatopsis cihanbeyliensis]TQJ05036.1 cell wall-associated NlpC family hydrolase [Amycolatopsis cihanbeyliensis]
MKIAIAAVAAIIAIPILIGGIGKAIVSALVGTGGTEPSQAALAEIPNDYLALYRAAASVCPGLDWTILAAIGDAESKHGRGSGKGIKDGENHMGAGGPMQFLKPTFNGVIARHTIPAGGANPPSRYNPHDAIYAAAFYLCDSGAQQDIRKALFAYNHSDQYVNSVLAQAKRYGTTTVGTGDCNKIQAPTPAAIAAINFACGQLGLPYVWGGNGPAGGHAGFDCSGLTKAAYNAAGISLPRTAQTQYNVGPLVPAGQPLLPGDLVFYGTPSNVHHVGLYIGAGKMVHAPTFGELVQISSYRWSGDDYLAASRPTN